MGLADNSLDPSIYSELISVKHDIVEALQERGSQIKDSDGLKNVPSEIRSLSSGPEYKDWFVTREDEKIYFDATQSTLYNFRSIKSATITLEYVPEYYFYSDSSLISINLPNFKSSPDTIKHICSGCSKLANVIIGSKENPFDGSEGFLSENLYYTFYDSRSMLVYFDSDSDVFEDLVEDFNRCFVNYDSDKWYAYKENGEYVYKYFDTNEGEWIDSTEEDVISYFEVDALNSLSEMSLDDEEEI